MKCSLSRLGDLFNLGKLNSFAGEPMKDGFWRYHGGLTTPTCNEHVVWTVMKEPIGISANQVRDGSVHIFMKDDIWFLQVNATKNERTLFHSLSISKIHAYNFHYPAVSGGHSI